MVVSDDPDENSRVFSCSGTGVVPDINVLPSALNFASQLVGSQSVTQFVTIQNTGSAELHITSISSSSSQFLLRLGTVLPATVTPGGSLPVGVQFAPTTTGISSGTVTVVSDDPDENSRVVSCSGTGVTPDINVLPSALNFASQFVGSQSVTQL